MNPELRDLLYESFAYIEEDKEGMTRMFNGLGIHAALEELSWDDLQKLEDKGSLWSPTVLKYVLPRWLELLDGGDCPSWELDQDMLRYRLVHDRWTQWYFPEVEAVRAVLREWGQTAMRVGTMDDFVCFIGELEEEAAPYLDPWLRSRPVEVARWITEQNWVRAPSVLARWVIQPRVEEKMDATFWTNPDGEYAELFSQASQLLRSVRVLRANG